MGGGGSWGPHIPTHPGGQSGGSPDSVGTTCVGDVRPDVRPRAPVVSVPDPNRPTWRVVATRVKRTGGDRDYCDTPSFGPRTSLEISMSHTSLGRVPLSSTSRTALVESDGSTSTKGLSGPVSPPVRRRDGWSEYREVGREGGGPGPGSQNLPPRITMVHWGRGPTVPRFSGNDS